MFLCASGVDMDAGTVARVVTSVVGEERDEAR